MLPIRSNISHISTQDCSSCESWAIAIENNYLYSAARSGFDIFEIQSNGSLNYINSYESTDFWGTNAIHVSNNILAVQTEILTSQLFNVSNPYNISVLSNVRFGYDFLIHNNLLYVCSNYEGVYIYNITTPNQPIHLETIEVYKGGITKAFIEDDLIYLIYGGYVPGIPFILEYNALAIYDIAKITYPIQIILEEDFFSGRLYEVYVREGNIYLTGEEGIYHCYYYNNKIIFKKLQHGFPFAQIVIKGDFLFTGSDPIYVYDIMNPSDPVYLSSFQGNSRAVDIAISGETLYLANGEDGISAINIISRYTSRLSILFGFDLSFICAGFAFAMVLIILINRKSIKKFTNGILSR
ncbi:MAG: hypothetical protein FK731_00885 [Asgard group archaeon]|nr:hypothetical protein [Asgard group archaeon]